MTPRCDFCGRQFRREGGLYRIDCWCERDGAWLVARLAGFAVVAAAFAAVLTLVGCW